MSCTRIRPAPTPARDTITAGPRWYRRRIRAFGFVLGLVPMAVLGAIAYVAIEFDDSRTSGLIGLLAGGAAAPGLLVAGAPFADDTQFPLAVAASIPLWLFLGFVASRRATSQPVASWRDFWRELLWLTLAVVVGAGLALVVATAVLGQSLVI